MWAGGSLRESGAQSCCLFHHLTVTPQGTEMRAWTSLGSPMEGKDFLVERMMTE